MIPESIQDIEIKYLYVKSFEYTDTLKKEVFAGHPIQGKVYRAIFNKSTKNWKVVVPSSNDVILFPQLVDQNEHYTSEMVEIDLKNIVSLQLAEEALDQIIKWTESKNQDLFKMYEPQLNQLQQAMHQQAQQEIQASNRAMATLMNLLNLNQTKFEILLQFAEALVQDELFSAEDPTSWMSLHKDYGSGINIKRAMIALADYSSDDRRTNQDVDDLFEAMTACVTEIERKINNDQID